MNVFAKSLKDFTSHKGIFTHHIYQLSDSISFLKSYLQLFLRHHFEVNNESGIDVTKVLGLKQSASNNMEFTRESHISKLKLLMKSLNKHIMKQIQSKEVGNDLKIQYIALFVTLVTQTEEVYSIGINEEIDGQVAQLMSETTD